MVNVSPDDVFRVAHYWYQWARQYDKGEDGMVAMSKDWWRKWAVGLLRNAFPVMQEILKPEYTDKWLEGLAERLAVNGFTPEEIEAVFAEAVK